MSLRETIGRITKRFNNAEFKNPREEAAVAQRLRERISNALETQNGSPGTDPAAGGVNYRGLYNRVQNSTLSDEDKKGLLNRITNAANGSSGGGGATGPTKVDTAAAAPAELDDQTRGEIEKRRLLAKA